MATVNPNYRGYYKMQLPVNMFSAIEDCEEYELGKVFKMLFIYSMNDKQLTYRYTQLFEYFNADPRVRSIFKIFKPILDPQIEKYKEMCERNAKNGRKGGRPRNDGTPAQTEERKLLYNKRELLEEILSGLKGITEEEIKDTSNRLSEPEFDVTPYPVPYFYENYASYTNAMYYDVVNT